MLAWMRIKTDLVKPGYKLASEVHTPTGGLLFYKERLISEMDIEILKAFQIEEVEVAEVDSKLLNKPQKPPENDVKSNKVKPLSFDAAYQSALDQLKKVLSTSLNQKLPVLEIRQIVQQLVDQIQQFNPFKFALKNVKEEDYIYHSALLVSLGSWLLAKWSGHPQNEWMQIALGGIIHDIGKLKIDERILNKKSALNHEEFEEMKKHTIFGYEMVKNIPGLNEGAKLTVLQHHEREDGSGYPLKLTSDRIHVYSKIVAIVDIYYAMTLPKIYKRSASPFYVMDQILNDGFGKLNPALTRNFVSNIIEFSKGSMVRLSNGSIGEIIFNDQFRPTRPWVKVKDQVINLSQESQITIDQIIG